MWNEYRLTWYSVASVLTCSVAVSPVLHLYSCANQPNADSFRSLDLLFIVPLALQSIGSFFFLWCVVTAGERHEMLLNLGTKLCSITA